MLAVILTGSLAEVTEQLFLSSFGSVACESPLALMKAMAIPAGSLAEATECLFLPSWKWVSTRHWVVVSTKETANLPFSLAGEAAVAVSEAPGT